jgi:5-methylcytosine-specific restriction endonuclease McrA
MVRKLLRRLAGLPACASAGEAVDGPNLASERWDGSVRVGGPLPSAWVKLSVWRRDQGECVRCGSQESVWFDYVVPVWEGGAITEENIRLMCRGCASAARRGRL